MTVLACRLIVVATLVPENVILMPMLLLGVGACNTESEGQRRENESACDGSVFIFVSSKRDLGSEFLTIRAYAAVPFGTPLEDIGRLVPFVPRLG